MTFDHSLILHHNSKTVEILWLGKAHTDGDVFAYLPKQKVLVTGDALHAWTPYMGDSYPMTRFLGWMRPEKLDFQHVISGHGDVLDGKEKFELWKQYFRDLLEETARGLCRRRNPRSGRKKCLEIARYASKFDPSFPQHVVAKVTKAYQVVAFAPQ